MYYTEFQKGIRLRDSGKKQEALEHFRLMIDRYSSDTTLRRQVESLEGELAKEEHKSSNVYYLLVVETGSSCCERETIIQELTDNLEDGIKIYLKEISNYDEKYTEKDTKDCHPTWDFHCNNKSKDYCRHSNRIICKKGPADADNVQLLKLKLGESIPIGNYQMYKGFILFDDANEYKEYQMLNESEDEYNTRLQKNAVQEIHQLPIMISWLKAYNIAHEAYLSKSIAG